MEENTALTKISAFLDAPLVRSRFTQMMGERGASTYISSVLLSVADSEKLQQCAPVSVYTSALRAATLRLSVDPGIGQAYLIPMGGRATLVVGYKGLHDMAVRTNKYRYINVGPVYEGENVIEDRLSGFHKIEGQKKAHTSAVIGWVGAFELFSGYAHTIYMTIEEIHEHAKKYSKSYNSGPWQTETPKMERKTVLRLLLRHWGYMDPSDVQVLDEIDGDEPNIVDAEINQLADRIDIPEEETEEKPTRPYIPAILKERIESQASDYRQAIAGGNAKPCTDNNRKVLAATLGKIFKSDTERYELCDWLTGSASTKAMRGEYVLVLLTWLGVSAFEDEPDETARKEAITAHTEALVSKGQLIFT